MRWSKCCEQTVTATLKCLTLPILFLLHYLYPLILDSLVFLSLITSLRIRDVLEGCRAMPGQCLHRKVEMEGVRLLLEHSALCTGDCFLKVVTAAGCSSGRWQGIIEDLSHPHPMSNFLLQPLRKLVCI